MAPKQTVPSAPSTPSQSNYGSPIAPWWMFGMGGLFGYGIGNGSGVCN